MDAEKCEGAIGSLATVAPDRGPSHPPQHRLRIAIAGDFPEGAASRRSDTTPRSARCKPHQGTALKVRRVRTLSLIPPFAGLTVGLVAAPRSYATQHNHVHQPLR